MISSACWLPAQPGWRAFAAVLLIGLSGVARASAATPSPLATPLPATFAAVRQVISTWTQWGEDHPMEVLVRLGEVIPPEQLSTTQWAQLRLTTQGLVAARSGLTDEVEAATQGLRQLQRNRDDTLIAADMALIGAVAADLRGASEQAAVFAGQADAQYEAACDRRAVPEACDPRHRWLALRVLASRAVGQGNRVDAYALYQRALTQAEAAEEPMMQCFTLDRMGMLSRELGESDRALREVGQADRLARQFGSAAVLAVHGGIQAMWAQGKGDSAAAERAMAEALNQAKRSGSDRLVASAQINLSDGWARGDRPAQALAALEQALPVLQRHHDLRSLALLMHNRGLAHLGLGQLAAGRSDLEEALSLWQAQDAKALMESALREHSEALGRRGDTQGALALYHREEALREDIQTTNRKAVVMQLRQRYSSEAEQRELALLARDNSLRASQLRTQTLVRQVWALAAVLMLLVAVAVYVMLRRAREANRQLRHSEALLKVQNERDALTGLANRRHLRDVMQSLSAGQTGFEGAMLLLDIDHFKRINDGHGHGAGDAVLVEIARRLSEAVRGTDVVCRWGGEEFLVFAPELQGEALDALAARILSRVAEPPMCLPEGQMLSVTASLGYASFPLPPQLLALDWEKAVNLVDLALYTAKSGGRDRSVRLSEVKAYSLEALEALEHEFQQAHRQGRITLVEHPRGAH